LVKLKIKDIEFSYPGVPVLKGVRLDIMPGELLAVIGKNGAGKSTFIKCMNRILEPGSGKIFLGDRELRTIKRKDIAKSMAYLSQKDSYAFPVTVFDAVLSGRYPHRTVNSTREDEARVCEVLRMLELEPLALRYFNELSGGQQQQVLIARAIVQQASIFLLDEPTSDLDIKHQLEVMETILRLVREENVTAVITIHDLNLASRYADRVIMLHNGEIFAAGPANAVLNEENIALAYGVRVFVNHIEGRPHIIPLRPIGTECKGREDSE
jgi:iron complex transport system ATP-binding protein